MLSSAKSMLRRIRGLGRIIADYAYDARRYFRYSSTGRSELGYDGLRARLYQKSHSIEKGLSMPVVRSGFGETPFRELTRCLAIYEREGYDRTDPAYRKAIGVINAYVEHHRDQAFPARLEFIRSFEGRGSAPADGGVMLRTREEILAGTTGDFASLVASRHSIRMFADAAVSRDALEAAVSIAAGAPSVCNRQGGHIHIVERPDAVAAALKIQGGNHGFSDQIKTLVVVTELLPIFRDSRERNQAYIDGGLFAMTLLYALHSLGLGACPLNWSTTRHTDRALRKALDLPDEETVVVMIAVGELRDEFRVARSARRPVAQIIRYID